MLLKYPILISFNKPCASFVLLLCLTKTSFLLEGALTTIKPRQTLNQTLGLIQGLLEVCQGLSRLLKSNILKA